MADLLRTSPAERDVDQAIVALKKGAYLLKYGRRGKPKFCPFRLSSDESTLLWYYGKDEKQLDLRQILRIIPGQRTAIFQRYPRPEKEYQSFSLIYSDRSLDLICKDKEEAEIWFVALKALIARSGSRKTKYEGKTEMVSSDNPLDQRNSPSNPSFDLDTPRSEKSRMGKAFADIVSYTATSKNPLPVEAVGSSVTSSSGVTENPNGRSSGADNVRVSLSSAVSSSSQGSSRDDFDSLGDVYIWGEGTGKGVLGGGHYRVGQLSSTKVNANTPKIVESTMVLDVQSVACGNKHAILVTKQGEAFSWGEETEGRLGHGVETDLSYPKLIDTLIGMDIKMVACGDYHTCALTLSGDLYTWGDGCHNSGLLGHRREVSHWIPKKISGLFDSLRVSYVSCGPWHTALITSAGQLFSFGDGTFGALGHGDRNSTNIPREVEALKGLCTIRVACGVWHTAAVVEATNGALDSQPSDGSLSGKLFTWGDGDKGQLGHGDNAPRLAPHCVAASLNFSQVACGHNLTVALTTSGRVYTMGSTVNGQLGNPVADGKTPLSVGGDIADSFVEDISCGSHHVAVLTSKSEVYTWGKGSNGQLGHGDNDDRSTPVLVDFLKNKLVKNVVCGSNFTAAICLHKGLSGADNSVCSGCQNPFNFRRKRHNCYNCGLVFCKACSDRKSMNASLARSPNKPYRVCDDCFTKLQKSVEFGSASRIPKARSRSTVNKSIDATEKETGGPQLLGNFSRLSSSGSSNLDEYRSAKSSSTVSQSNDSSQFIPPNGNIQRSSISSWKSTNDLKRNYMKFLSVPVSTSRMVSRLASPITQKSSLVATPSIDPQKEESVCDSEQSNDALHEEIKYLRAQILSRKNDLYCKLMPRKDEVEELASKSQLIEAELRRKSQQLLEAEAKAMDEAKKTKAAKEAIKYLTLQLKERSGIVSEEHMVNRLMDPNTQQISKNPTHSSDRGRPTTSQTSSTSESTVNPVFSNGTKTQVPGSDMARLTTGQASSTIESTINPVFANGMKTQVASSDRVRVTTSQTSSTSEITVNPVFSNGKKTQVPSSDRVRVTTSQASSTTESTINPAFSNGMKTQVPSSDRDRVTTSQASSTTESTVNPIFSNGTKTQVPISDRVRVTTSLASSTSENTVNPVFSNGTKTRVPSFDRVRVTTSEASSTSESTVNPVLSHGTKTRLHSSDRARVSTSQASPTSESTINPVFSMGTKIQLQMSEHLIREDPGVYIIVSPMPSGVNELKRVRFSRKHFSEKQAETWWSENEKEIFQRHNIRAD